MNVSALWGFHDADFAAGAGPLRLKRGARRRTLLAFVLYDTVTPAPPFAVILDQQRRSVCWPGCSTLKVEAHASRSMRCLRCEGDPGRVAVSKVCGAVVHAKRARRRRSSRQLPFVRDLLSRLAGRLSLVPRGRTITDAAMDRKGGRRGPDHCCQLGRMATPSSERPAFASA